MVALFAFRYGADMGDLKFDLPDDMPDRFRAVQANYFATY